MSSGGRVTRNSFEIVGGAILLPSEVGIPRLPHLCASVPPAPLPGLYRRYVLQDQIGPRSRDHICSSIIPLFIIAGAHIS